MQWTLPILSWSTVQIQLRSINGFLLDTQSDGCQTTDIWDYNVHVFLKILLGKFVKIIFKVLYDIVKWRRFGFQIPPSELESVPNGYKCNKYIAEIVHLTNDSLWKYKNILYMKDSNVAVAKTLWDTHWCNCGWLLFVNKKKESVGIHIAFTCEVAQLPTARYYDYNSACRCSHIAHRIT